MRRYSSKRDTLAKNALGPKSAISANCICQKGSVLADTVDDIPLDTNLEGRPSVGTHGQIPRMTEMLSLWKERMVRCYRTSSGLDIEAYEKLPCQCRRARVPWQ